MYAIRSYYAYLEQIRVYESEKVSPELEHLRGKLIILIDESDHAVNKVMALEDNEFIDFHARRMVEMAGYIIMSYLLLLDSNRDQIFVKSAKNFLRLAKAQVKAHAEFIRTSELSDLGTYKYEME